MIIPTYCPQPACRAFIHPRQITNHLGTCPRCSFKVCILCHLPQHLPSKHCIATILPNFSAIQLQAAFDDKLSRLEEAERNVQHAFSRAIQINAKAARDLPRGLSKSAAKEFRENVRAHHWKLFREKSDQLEKSHQQKQLLRDDHAKAMAFRG